MTRENEVLVMQSIAIGMQKQIVEMRNERHLTKTDDALRYLDNALACVRHECSAVMEALRKETYEINQTNPSEGSGS